MKKTRQSNGTLEALLVIGLILIIPLFFVIRTAAEQNAAQNTPAPAQPTEANAPALPTPANTEEDSAMKPKQPPACTFPLAEITAPEATPEEYTFSEPKVVLTAPKGNIYTIAEWLPDNQQVLITEQLRNAVLGNDTNLQEKISLYNPETGELKVYAIRSLTNGAPPSWFPELNAVVYPVMNFYDIDRKALTYKVNHQIWISYGDPNTAQVLTDDLSQLSVAFKPGGGETLYLSDKKIFKLDKLLHALPPTSFDSSEWDYAKEWRNDKPVSYIMAWQPGTALIFLYSESAMQAGGYTFILNASTGDVCELNLGGWAKVARWSSDGRYLAIKRATNFNETDLTLLNTITGEITTLGGMPEGMEGKFYVYDLIWAPDSRHLLVMGSAVLSQNNQGEGIVDGLYLIDIVTEQSMHVASEYKNIANPSDNNWAWSSDGSKLLARCPKRGADQICLISVTQTGQ
jgi:hypothetical protein